MLDLCGSPSPVAPDAPSVPRVGGAGSGGCLATMLGRRPLWAAPILSRVLTRRATTTAATSAAQPTRKQLWRHALASAVPMVGFGFMDNTVMLQMGNTLDCTIGVAFGLSTLSAAAMGQACSDVAGILFGDTVERACRALGLPASGLSLEQRRMTVSKRVALLGSCVGVVCGCCLGMVNLLFMDTGRASKLKSYDSVPDEGGVITSLSGHGFRLSVSNRPYLGLSGLRDRSEEGRSAGGGGREAEGDAEVARVTSVVLQGPIDVSEVLGLVLDVARQEGGTLVGVSVSPRRLGEAPEVREDVRGGTAVPNGTPGGGTAGGLTAEFHLQRGGRPLPLSSHGPLTAELLHAIEAATRNTSAGPAGGDSQSA